MAETMDARALAVAAGTSVERIEEMTGVRILVPAQDGTYRPSDIQRVRIAEALDAAGTSPDQIGQMIADGTYSTGWADLLFPEPVPMSGQTLADAIGELGLPYDMVRRVFTIGLQLPTPELHEELRDDELELLRIMTLIYFAFGRDEPGAVRCSLSLTDDLPLQGLPPAHVGVHVGNVVFRDGDYFGRTVNLAARLCSHAEPGEVLTTREVMDACAGRRDVRWQQAGSATLKGIQEPVEIFRAVRADV